jgi:hypothetical protein
MRRDSSYWQWFYAPQGLEDSARRFNAGNLPTTTTRPAGAPEERRYHTTLVTTADLTPCEGEWPEPFPQLRVQHRGRMALS